MANETPDLDAMIDALGEPPEPAPAVHPAWLPPVILPTLPAEDYHADLNSVGIGGLALMRKTPHHHFHHCRRPDRIVEPPTPAQLFGLLVHCLLLEPEEFESRFAVWGGADRRTKEGKAAYAEFETLAAGRLEIRESERRNAERIVASVLANPRARALFTGPGKHEASVFWSDKATGVRCRMRPDRLPDDRPLIVDAKCTQDAGEFAIERTAVNLNWPMRAAWYVDGWKALTGEDREYVFACWESDAPFEFASYYASQEALAIGRQQYRKLLVQYAECLEKDSWPGYPPRTLELPLPNWFLREN